MQRLLNNDNVVHLRLEGPKDSIEFSSAYRCLEDDKIDLRLEGGGVQTVDQRR